MAISEPSATVWGVALAIAADGRWATVAVLVVGLGRGCQRGRNVPRDLLVGRNGKKARDLALYSAFIMLASNFVLPCATINCFNDTYRPGVSGGRPPR